MKKLFNAVKQNLLYAGVNKREYEEVFYEIEESNRQNLMIFSVITCCYLIFMVVLSLFYEIAKNNREAYIISLICTVIILCVAKWCPKHWHKLLLADMYLFVSILFVFGIVLGSVFNPDEQAVTFIVLILTVPLLFTDRPLRMICFILIYFSVFVVFVVKYKSQSVIATDIIDASIFSTVSAFVSTYMMRVKCQRYVFEYKLSLLSVTDLLTGLNNRNSFERNMAEYADKCEKDLYCIFVDVNGLHEINNTKGHSAGDKMLQYIGGILQEYFGNEDTYRIGGDEFVVFVVDECEDVICNKIDKVVNKLAEMSYHASLGYSCAQYPDMNVTELINDAERKMYDAKRMYYQQRGVDRRARR